MIYPVIPEVGMIEEYLQPIKYIVTNSQALQPFMSSQQNRFYFPFASGPSQTIASVYPAPVMRFRPPTGRYFLRSHAAKLARSQESITHPNEQNICHIVSSNVRLPLMQSAAPIMKFQAEVQNLSANRTFCPESRSQTWPNLSSLNFRPTSVAVRPGVASNASIKVHSKISPHVANTCSGIQNDECPRSMACEGPNQHQPVHCNLNTQSTDANVLSRISNETQDSHQTSSSTCASNAPHSSGVSCVSIGNLNSTPHPTGIDHKGPVVSVPPTGTPVTSIPNSSLVAVRPTTLMNLPFKAVPTVKIHTRSSRHASQRRSRSAERPLRSPLRPPSNSPSRPPFPIIPCFFGWFLESDDAITLINRARQIAKQLCDDSELSKWLGWSLTDSVWIKTYSHCTSKFCGYGKREGAAEYTNQAWKKLGCRTKLNVDAIFVTSRCVGARVRLSKCQKSWWAGEQEAIPTAPHITLAVRQGIAPVICGRDLANMMKNLSSQETKSGVCVWVDSRGEGCLIDVKGVILPSTFRAFPN